MTEHIIKITVSYSTATSQWLAHCLDLDLVAFAGSPDAVLGEVESAICEAVLDDRERGVNPFEDLGTTPRVAWAEWYSLPKGPCGQRAFAVEMVLRESGHSASVQPREEG